MECSFAGITTNTEMSNTLRNMDSQPTMWSTPLNTRPNTSPADPAGDRPSIGLTPDDRSIFVAYELDIEDGEEIIVVVTAYSIGDEP